MPGDAINNVQDLLKHNITIFEIDYYFENYRDWYLKKNISEWERVANTAMVPADYSCMNGTQICADINGTWEYFIKHHLHGNKTHAFVRWYLEPYELEVMPEKSNWWRSDKLEFGSNPYSGIITSRNWILNEVNSSLLSTLTSLKYI